jgi:GrpB-like predicted nucleotidyltransferase (UPF0157 family)
MKTKKVIVLPYDQAWEKAFKTIKSFLDQALKDQVIAIEHIGSTSVEGLAAKPIIDIDIIIDSDHQFEAVKNSLEQLGYRHEGDLGIKDREAFKYDTMHDLMKHHLYVCPSDSIELKKHLTFRDYLRTHPDDRDRYSEIKKRAAMNHPEDIDGYIEEKSPLIESIYRKLGF